MNKLPYINCIWVRLSSFLNITGSALQVLVHRKIQGFFPTVKANFVGQSLLFWYFCQGNCVYIWTQAVNKCHRAGQYLLHWRSTSRTFWSPQRCSECVFSWFHITISGAKRSRKFENLGKRCLIGPLVCMTIIAVTTWNDAMICLWCCCVVLFLSSIGSLKPTRRF